jgi:hypothetical protein
VTAVIEISFLFLMLTVWKTQEEKIKPSWCVCIYTWEVNRWCRQEHSWSKVRNKYSRFEIISEWKVMKYVSYVFHSFCMVGTSLKIFHIMKFQNRIAVNNEMLLCGLTLCSLIDWCHCIRVTSCLQNFGNHLLKHMVSHSRNHSCNVHQCERLKSHTGI